MAQQSRKSQSDAFSKNGKVKASGSRKGQSSTQNNGRNNKSEALDRLNSRGLPPRLISSGIFLGIFILLLVMFFHPEGALVNILGNVIYGLLGATAFFVAIPATLYLFLIHAFSGKRPVIGRTVCLGTFIIICGCLSHLTVGEELTSKGLFAIGELYTGGINGSSGGVVCGLLANLLQWLVGRVISYVIFICAAIITFLGGMSITIPSIIRAIQDRPRAEWEDEEPEQEEPAAVVVNHIAKKRIEYIENKRNRQALQEAQKCEHQKNAESRAEAVFSQIEGDVETPVAAASGVTAETDISPTQNHQTAEHHHDFAEQPQQDMVPSLIPSKDVTQEMPPLTMSAPVFEEDIPPVFQQEKTTQVPVKKKVTARQAQESAEKIADEIQQKNEEENLSEYSFPPIELLKSASGASSDGSAEMRENSRRLNETLASFKIEAHIINVTRGPSVTRYEVELEKGVRLNKLTTAADDIALSLGATGVRIAAIPGKISVVGIEVPNRAVTMVSLREVIDSNDFNNAKSKSSFAVGKDIGGKCIIGNIARLPHMLIAGTTGSGKSVCMNSIIISLLYKASPDEVKLIMVDPKMVELGIYNGIPHLLIPVVTDPKKAAGSLQWAVTEMMRRYKAMSDAGVRDLASYNSIMESQDEAAKKLPQVVVIIDELADLMLVAAKEVEESICRIAQMGRAAGIHLIIATQRPSADVITGLMKANIPSRIAFAVASAMESRIILDTQGAEKLVGKGDMLYAPIGNGKPKRVQGCFVSDSEVEAVANYVKNHYITDYDQDVIEEIEKKAAQTGTKTASVPEPNADETDGDEMLPAAVEVILDTKQASVSMLQRRLKLGYARAARIVDEMEDRGIVGPFQGSKPREILITREQWQAMQDASAPQMGFDDMEQEEETE